MCAFGHVTYVGVGAAWNTANVQAASTVAIFGLGSVGLAVSFFSFFLLVELLTGFLASFFGQILTSCVCMHAPYY